MNKYADSTLKRMTKNELIRYVRICAHNLEIAKEFNKQQVELDEQPTADVQPIRHGKWIYSAGTSIEYCPFCGAKLDREE